MIRSMEPSDRPTVRALQRELAYAGPELVDAAIDGPFVGIVAHRGDRVVGYAIAFPGRPATLSELVVAPDSRRAGHGRALVESVVSTVEADRVLVATPVGNEAAKEFYTALGFDPDGIRSGFYADGTDALGFRRRE